MEFTVKRLRRELTPLLHPNLLRLLLRARPTFFRRAVGGDGCSALPDTRRSLETRGSRRAGLSVDQRRS
ncbi:hypothetical protein JOB18_035524 [Solea senegalensis]|uniref:Uncharacterized protein n=1 Tax=Solea senegalensis TaxID=28829 RepID=A0AAV6Q3N1_SOLSE|nr:hypothetical protein JOB18_035524 [Solea senegalensis]